MTARRMLFGTGAGLYAAPIRAFELSAAPAGGWTWFNDPRAVYDAVAGKTFFGYLRGDNGDVCVRAWDHATRAAGAETVLHAALEVDDHDNPGVIVRPSDGKVLTLYSGHSAPQTYKRISSSAHDVSAFAAEAGLDSIFLGDTYTYANPVALSNQDSSGPALSDFFRDVTGGGDSQWWYATSLDDGDTWVAVAHLHTLTYSRVETDGVGKVHVAASDHPGDGATAIYHLYRESAAWRKSDGTSLPGGSMPYGPSSLTLIHDASPKKAWIHDVAIGLDGHPRVTFVVFESTADHRYWYGRWTGSAWDCHEIVAGGSTIALAPVGPPPFVLEDYYSGGVVLDHSDPTVVWASVQVGTDEWEIRRYITADGGATWAYSVVSPPGGKNVRPSSVRDHADDLEVVWMRGDYTSYVDYSVATWGAGR